MPLILEGLVSTLDVDGTLHVAPMGPAVEPDMRELLLRPYTTSTTYRNLRRTGQGVFHVTDDVELLARSAVGRLDAPPPSMAARAVEGRILTNACRWYAFRVREIDDREERVRIVADVVDSGALREFLGFNRAMHAVVEAAILATRTRFLPADELLAEIRRLASPVEKTGGAAERRAFDLLSEHIFEACAGDRPNDSRSAPWLARESPRLVTVNAPSRLHFGMFGFKQPETRQFGGVGAMLREPGLQLEFSPASEFCASGPGAERLATAARRLVSAGWQCPARGWAAGALPPCRVAATSTARPHVGLGTGTQTALALAAGLCEWFGLPEPSPHDLASAVGRGERSAVGLHGFARGGLICEAGKRRADEISPLVAHAPLPADWRFVLLCPAGEQGRSGEAERAAFQALPPTTAAQTANLARIALLELLPAAVAGEFAAFGEALYTFGRDAGDCFSAIQGGPYATPKLQRLVESLRELGVAGVGQSSWGPTLFALTESDAASNRLVRRLQAERDFAGLEFTTARPANRGRETTRV